MKKLLLLLLLLAAASMPLYASWDNAGTTSAEFLKIDGSARSMGLGGSYAVLDDINNMSVNPALIGYGKCLSAGLNYISFYQDVSYLGLNTAYKPDGVNGFALGLIFLDSGTINMTGDSPDVTGTTTKRDYAVIAGYGREVGSLFGFSFLRDLYLGLDIRYYKEGFGDFSYQGALADFGSYYKIPFVEGLSAGFSLLNFRFFSSDTAPSPISYKIGGRYDMDIYRMNKKEKDISFLVDLEKTEGMAPNIAAGTEFHFFDMLSVRLGYRLFHDTGSFSAGIGLTYFGYTLSYSISPFSDLGLDNQFSLSYAMDCPSCKDCTNIIKKEKQPEWYRINMDHDCYSLIAGKDVTFTFDIEKEGAVSNWEFSILNDKTVVRQYKGGGEIPSRLVWNGRDDRGALLDEGNYTVNMKLVYAQGSG
jgi:hypothetical protein